ncbi:MAG: hypothetical protein ACI4EE_11375 [Lachnospiraceae bacterium]
MRRIAESDIKKHLKAAAGQLTPAYADAIWQQPVEQATGDEWYLKDEKRYPIKAGKAVKLLASAAACLTACVISLQMIGHRTDATIYLDVNPSVELEINSRDKVLSANADNADGEIILEDMDLEHTDLDVALNAIIGSMVKHGYLNEAQKMILLSVDSKNDKRAEELRQQISDELNAELTSLLGAGSVLDQSVAATDDLKKLAEQYQITPGKALLLQRLIEENPNLDYGQLAKMPINELISYLKQSGVDVRNYVHCTGDDLDDEDDLYDELEDLFDDDDRDDDDMDDLKDDDYDDDDTDDDIDDTDDDDDDVDDPDDDRDDDIEDDSDEHEDDDDDDDGDDDDDKDDDDKKAVPNQRPTKNGAKKDVPVSNELDDTDEEEEDEEEEDEADEDESDEDEEDDDD